MFTPPGLSSSTNQTPRGPGDLLVGDGAGFWAEIGAVVNGVKTLIDGAEAIWDQARGLWRDAKTGTPTVKQPPGPTAGNATSGGFLDSVPLPVLIFGGLFLLGGLRLGR